MADNNVPEVPTAPVVNKPPEMTSLLQPGVDHQPGLVVPIRENIAQQAGVSVTAVTPPSEVAENIMNEASKKFVEQVAGVVPEIPTTNPADLQDEGSSNIREILNAYNPFGSNDNKEITDRTAPGKEPLSIEQARNEKMNVAEFKKAA